MGYAAFCYGNISGDRDMPGDDFRLCGEDMWMECS